MWAVLDSPLSQGLGAGRGMLCCCQQDGSCQVSGSLAVAAVGRLLFSCFAFACRLGLLSSSVLVKAAGSFETFASHQQAAAHSSQQRRALGRWCDHSQGKKKARECGELAGSLHPCWECNGRAETKKEEDALFHPSSCTCIYWVSSLQLVEIRKRQRHQHRIQREYEYWDMTFLYRDIWNVCCVLWFAAGRI